MTLLKLLSLCRYHMGIGEATPDKMTKEEARRTLTVKNKMGIHARPAAMIVRISNRFSDVDLWVEKDDELVNGKSIMGLMMLAAGQGSELTFVATGGETDKLLDEMEDLFERKFEEA